MKFHEYWDNENKLLELSYKESIRQRDERKRRNTMAIPKKKYNVVTGHMHTKHWEVEAYDKADAESKLPALLESLEYNKDINQYDSNVFKETLKTIPDAVVMAIESPNELDDKQRADKLNVE
jgi:hypothetical protein|tara:strand:+ start:302 stop:667 length:366 start_codon:yes stop_codon:yes gene_type:complete